jgi:hypothetical protein
MELNKLFHGRVAGDIHDQVNPVVTHELFDSVGHSNVKISGPQKTGCGRVAI